MQLLMPAWLDQAVFYEIYPQSFYDSNADGIGDIPGIIQKLDYIESLGVNAVWLNPCFDSPFQDAGYDVRDYYRVAARYGTNNDLRRLFVEARRRNIRILLDLVAGHTSIEHPWFKASCSHSHNEFSDWFIWTGSAWTWNVPGMRAVSGFGERDGAYITNFFYSQPALNYGFARPDPEHSWQQPVDAPGPQRVRQEMRSIMKFWLEMGASGFRVDMASSLVKSDPGHRETALLWQEMRAWLEESFPEAALVAEWSNPSEALPAGFHIDFLLHFGQSAYTSLFRKSYPQNLGFDPYGFSFFDRAGRGNIRAFLDEYLHHYESTSGTGYMALVSGNHDIFPRLSEGRDVDDLEQAFLFLLTMPGTPFIYYGDEIGMRSLKGLPSLEGGYHRTGARTPMQWSREVNAGFSQALPGQLYLPIDPDPDRPAVSGLDHNPSSLLNRVRRLIALRKAYPALCAAGSFTPVVAENGVYPFVFLRGRGTEQILVAVNPAGYAVETALPDGVVSGLPATLYGREGALSGDGTRWILQLPAVSGGVYLLQG